MFCSNCGNKLADGAKFCSSCGARVQAEVEREFRFNDVISYEEPKLDTENITEKAAKEKPVFSRESISFDWSNVVDEPHKKEIPDVRSPWASSGRIDEKELYAEMTPSTDRSRTMSFIDVLKAEKEEKEKKADEKAFVYTEVLELDHDMSSFDDPPQMHYAPLYDDVDAPVRTPFDDIDAKPEAWAPDINEEPGISASKETIAQFDEYVRSFEAGLLNDEPRFEEPIRPAKEEPKFELPNFLSRAGSHAEEEPAEKPAAGEPVFEAPKYEEPVFEEPKYEEPKFEDDGSEDELDDYDAYKGPSDASESTEDLYLDLDTSKATIELSPVTGRAGRFEADEPEFPEEEYEAVDEEELFSEMRRATPEVSGMTIAPPADKASEIEELRRRLAELTGADEAEKPAASSDIVLEPENTLDIDEYFDGLTAASKAKAEITEEKEQFVLNEAEPEPVVLEAVEPEPVVLETVEPEPVVLEAVEPEPVVLEAVEPEPVVLETVEPEPVVLETVEPEPVVLEAVRPEPAAPEAVREEPVKTPEKPKASDALSLEDLEKDLFGETLTEEAEVEETKKIDKFYTLYRKNEEFQRLLDEEYDKLKGESAAVSAKPAAAQTVEQKHEQKPEQILQAAPEPEVPAENSKAYRQIEDETIYKAFEIPQELVKAPPKEVTAEEAAATGKRPVEAAPAETVNEISVKTETKAEKKAARAKARAEKKAAKARARAEAADSGAEYEEVDAGSGFLTVLAVIIAIILVILLAVILILQVAPDSGIAITIDSLIERLTGGFSAVYPGDGPFLL